MWAQVFKRWRHSIGGTTLTKRPDIVDAIRTRVNGQRTGAVRANMVDRISDVVGTIRLTDQITSDVGGIR
jgi:hypothetical protein